MKTVKLSNLPHGGVFCYAEHEFVIMEHLPEGGTLVLDCQNERALPFNDKDVEDRNDFRGSSIKEYLNGEYLDDLIAEGIDRDVILDLTIDLKATDGTRAYGYDTVKVGLLTLEQYGKYKDIIPLNENDWWWLASPWATRWLRSPLTYSTSYAWRVGTNGSYGNDDVTGSDGVRPVLRLDSELLVSAEGKDEDQDVDKAKSWTAYLRYLASWAIDHAGSNFYGASPAGFGEWLADECDREDEDDE